MRKGLGLLIVLSLTMLIILGGCVSGSGEGADSEKFRVGMEAGYAPFNWTQIGDSNGAVPIEGSPEYAGGYDVEIAKRIAEGLGKKLVIVKTEWDGLYSRFNLVKSRDYCRMSPTADRKETIDFSNNYYKSDLVMVVRKGGGYENATSSRISAEQNNSPTKYFPLYCY